MLDQTEGDIMNNTGKVQISYGEAFSILTVSQIFPTIAFSLNSQNGLSALSCMISFLLGTLFNFIIILPFIFLVRRFRGCSVLDCSYRLLGKFACVIAAILFVVLIATAAKTVSTFERFLSTEIFPDSAVFTIVLLITVSTAYGAFLGIEALGRVANIVFVLASLSIILVLVSVVQKIELLNFGTLEFSDIGNILKAAATGVFANTGLITALLIVPIVNKNHFKGFFFWNAASLILVEIIAFSVTGVLGDYAQTKMYPYYSTTTIADLSVFKRLDLVYMCVWILVAFIRITYYLILAKNVIDSFLSEKAKKYSLWVSSGIIFLLSVIMSLREVFDSYTQAFLSSGLMVSLIVFVLPLFLLVIAFIKGDKHNEKA